MSQFRLARLCLMLAALGAAPGLMTPAFAQKDDKATAAAPQNTVRQDLIKLIDSAQIKPLLDAKNFTEVQTRIGQAEALPNLTPYETYVINRLKISLGSSMGNDAIAIPALQSVIESGLMQPAEKDVFTQALANMYYNGKNYPKAIEWLKRYQKESATPEQVRPALVRAYYLSGDYGSAKTELMPVITGAEKAGKAPTEEDLRLFASAANKLKDDAGYLAAIEKLATYYPNDDFWTDMLNRGVQRKPGFDAQTNQINVFRLEFAAVQKMAPEEYVGLAELAMLGGFPTEAKKVMDAGFATGELGKGQNANQHRQLRDKAAKGAADDAKNIAAGEAAAVKSKTGAGLINLGWAYVTMEQFDKGIGYIQQGIAKGGLKHPDEAKLRLGMAYAKAGQKDEAIKTFQEVKAGGGLSDLARYWIMLEKQATKVAAK
jgi:tetratricopeptide (TPR) repeat protein